MRSLLALAPLIFLCCFRSQKSNDIIIAGSTSVQPFIEKLAEEFMAKHPEVKINVQGGGSTAGIQAVFNRTCAIGTSSRHLKPDEQDLHIFTMALDGIAVIIHRSNPLTNLTHEQLKDIFSGKIDNWKQVGGPDKKIIVVTREEGSGTRGAFEELIMHGTAISDACLVQDSNGAIREIVAITPQAIGYISAGLIDERIKAVSIDGVYPSVANLVSGKYKFVRPFLLLTKDEPSGIVRSIIEYALSPEAQEILQHNGLIPGTEFDK
ncbi:MAG: phosphate ABC transporter substrate-binding protein [bacterium]